MGYLFGPVLSRRLGLSMGVDLLKYKTCNLDCVYCELGRTSCLTSCRGRFGPRDKVLKEIHLRRDERPLVFRNRFREYHRVELGLLESTLCNLR